MRIALDLLLVASSAAYAPYIDLFGQPGGDAQKCSGAQLVRTDRSLLVWGICGGGAGVLNRSIWLRRSADWGVSWEPAVRQPHLGAGDLAQFIYDPAGNAIISLSPPPAYGGSCTASASCPLPYSCMSKSTDEGGSWSPSEPAGCHQNHTGGGSGEGCGGIALSSGALISPFGHGVGSYVIISHDGGGSWRPGNFTPALPSKQGWGESMVAELSNGSVVLTSRLSALRQPGWHWLPIQRGFSISHDGGRSWAKSWSFPADQPFDVNFGPGYNVEHGLTSAHNKSKLLLSKPTATLHGDSSGQRPQCGPHTQGSCAYRRNMTVASSSDGGASWVIEPWGLIYKDRAAYSDLVELPDGKIAVVFERSNSSLEEYRYVSVAVVTPSWMA